MSISSETIDLKNISNIITDPNQRSVVAGRTFGIYIIV